jgi:MFS family permease
MILKVWSTYKKAYAGLPRNAWLLSLVQFINRSGSMVLFFLTLYLTRKLGFTLIQAGQAVSTYGLGALAGAYLGGRMCDRLGANRVQQLSLLLSGLNLIVMGYVTQHGAVLLSAFLLGVFGEALLPANGTAMAQECPALIRTKGFALNRLAGNLGVTIGPVLGGYLALWNYRALFWVDGLTCLATLAVFSLYFKPGRKLLTADQETFPIEPVAGQKHHLWIIFLLVFGIGLIFSQLFSTFPLYMHSAFGFAENRIGQLLAINTIIIVLFEMVLLHGLKDIQPLKVIGVGALLIGLGFALTPLGRRFFYAALTVVVWTCGEMLSLPLLTAEISNRSSDQNRGRHMGLFAVSFSLAYMIGPLTGAKIYTQFSPLVLWFSCGGLGMLLALGFLMLERSGRSGKGIV